MSNPLERLREHRQALLLAEVGALLHDMGKCTDVFLEPGGQGFKAAKCKGAPRINPHKAIFAPEELKKLPYWHRLSEDRGQCSRLEEAKSETALWRTVRQQGLDPSVIDRHIEVKDRDGLEHEASLRELILWGRPLVSDPRNYHRFRERFPQRIVLTSYLGQTHNVAHVEKEEASNGDNKLISSPFGHETEELSDLSRKLKLVLKKLLNVYRKDPIASAERQEFVSVIESGFLQALGDTRRPENEVTLWDWSSVVASLYKAAVAQAVIKGTDEPHKLRWRLLRVNFDVLRLYAKAIKIGDLLGYQAVVHRACEAVKQLVEEEYPLGNEVYRDTTGIYFTFPDIELPIELKQLIRDKVTDIEPELAPRVAVGGGTGETATEQLKNILADQRKEALKDLAQPVTPENDDPRWQALWDELPPGRWEVCPVCQLRPKAESDDVCKLCRGRRQSRLQAWLRDPQTTIWIDEISDEYGRVALLVGRFGLDDWLSGDLVQTLLVKAVENDPDACQPKNPSPARLRRVWETTRRFWKEIEATLLPRHIERQPRLAFSANYVPAQGQLPESRQAYDLVVNGTKLPVFCRERNALRFLTIDRLDHVLKQLGQGSIEDLKRLLQSGEFALETSGEYGARSVRIGFLRNIEVMEQSFYTPTIALLAEPRTFMALVPADKALDIACAIKTKYEIEMGKVRDRLPLHLGLVFFPRKQPLRAVLEAGRAMLDGFARPTPEEQEPWEVAEVCEFPDPLPEQLKSDAHFRKGRTIELTRHGRRFRWHVPLTMGDGETEDVWYPYVFVAEEAQLQDRRRKFKGCRPTGQDGETEPCWLVHAGELRKNDRVYVTPSRFDFEFLDTTARRFELSYHDGRRREPARRCRPYLLEDLDQFQTLWDQIAGVKGLSTSQLKALDGLIEAKRQAWEQPTGHADYCEAFALFVRDALANTGWPKGHRPKGEKLEQLHRAALRGELHDVIELYAEILKQRPKRDQERGEIDGSSQVG